MFLLQWCKTQVMSFLILTYTQTMYVREARSLDRVTKKSNANFIFSLLLITADIAVLFDGATACTVNLLEQVPKGVNLLLHLGMYVSYEIFIALLFWYWVSVTVGLPKGKWKKAVCIVPSLILGGITICYLPSIEFLQGKYTNYSMGISVYVCFLTVAIYCALTVAVIVSKHRYIPSKKKKSLFTTLVFIAIIMSLQIVFPESLVSCIAAAMIAISIYLNMENPMIHSLEHYHYEMVMGFATLVENKDGNTGGHIRRSSAYAEMIAKNMRRMKKYKIIITKDYLNNLVQSAPMHDIGKVSISDAILQKPGKLTSEEFERMKEHAVIGGRIIQETFGHLLNNEYEEMAYQVATYHHEKWNGKGYPEGLSGTDIPLCARIMAVADVFDAVSSRRCYRDALPLEECYRIIQNGKGVDFDPDVVDAFLMDKEQVEDIYYRTLDKAQVPAHSV